jgi:hypothetical protein
MSKHGKNTEGSVSGLTEVLALQVKPGNKLSGQAVSEPGTPQHKRGRVKHSTLNA